MRMTCEMVGRSARSKPRRFFRFTSSDEAALGLAFYFRGFLVLAGWKEAKKLYLTS